MSDKQESTRTGWFRKGNRWVITIAVGTALTVGSVFGVQVLTNSEAYSHVQLNASDGTHYGRFAELSDADIDAALSEWPNMLRLKSMPRKSAG